MFASTTNDGNPFIGLIFLMILFAAYWAPTVVAWVRKHHQLPSIIVVNGLLGWTFVGWVVALAWCVSPPKQVD